MIDDSSPLVNCPYETSHRLVGQRTAPVDEVVLLNIRLQADRVINEDMFAVNIQMERSCSVQLVQSDSH